MNEEIIKLYQNGESMREIAKLTHHSRNTISKILKENNIHVRYQNETSKIYTCNESYFKEINSPDKAYWLGFLMADGFIESKRKNGNQKFGVTLQIKDEKHLYKFKEALNATNPIKIYKGSGYNKDGLFAKILITSQQIVDDLSKYGVVEHKTGIEQIPQNIPMRFVRDFIRGYFDGDGSIYFQKTNNAYFVSIVGPYDILQSINNFLNIDAKIHPDKSIYQVAYTNRKDVYNFLHTIYQDSSVYLDRKYQLYLDYLKITEK